MSKTAVKMVNRIFADEDLTQGVSDESQLKTMTLKDIYDHFYSPISRCSLGQTFYNLLFDWQSETRHLSSITEIAMNPHYQRIIGMGKEVVPLLLRQLENKPDHLFWALKAITGMDPVQPRQRGKIREMAQVWLKWARENGYQW